MSYGHDIMSAATKGYVRRCKEAVVKALDGGVGWGEGRLGSGLGLTLDEVVIEALRRGISWEECMKRFPRPSDEDQLKRRAARDPIPDYLNHIVPVADEEYLDRYARSDESLRRLLLAESQARHAAELELAELRERGVEGR